MEEIFETSEFSDCKIISKDGHEFKLHKNVLGTCSDVFKAMLTTNMKEKITGTITLDEDKKVLQELFEMIYTGTTKQPIVDNSALLIVANKYLITDVESSCVQILIEKLSLSNAVSTLFFAHEKDIQELKIKTISFIVE